MLGGEGEGLRANLRKRADSVVGVEGQRIGDGGVDSLNVSVAAGILCEAFSRKPPDGKALSPAAPSAHVSADGEESLF